MSTLPSPTQVVDFWIQAGPEKWFTKNDQFDADFKALCLDAHYAAARRELDSWMQTPEGALALILLLDQLPRNAFRNTGHMFATDGLGLMFAYEAIDKGFDQEVAPDLRPFILMPLMHSEAMADQDRLLELLNPETEANTHRFAVIHRDIIVEFGRYPHRNDSLGRKTTPAEAEFLSGDNFKG